MQNYVVIVLMKIPRNNPSYKLRPNSICIVFWGNICMVPIKEEIIPNPPFQSSGPLLVILIVYRDVDFIDTM